MNLGIKDVEFKEIIEKMMDSISTARANLTHLNILITGKTGTGKSTLINNVFSEELASTGIGKPVTQEIKSFSKMGFPLTIYDTPGIELEGQNSVEDLSKQIQKVINEGIRSGKIENTIHCIWYCISTPSHRIEESEIEFINKLIEDNGDNCPPIIVVLTQAFSKKDAQNLKEIIDGERLQIVRVVPVLASDYEIDEDYTAKTYGLDTLLETTEVVIPDAVRKTLVAVQKAALNMKIKKAQAVVAASSTGAAATGVIPIPFADAAALIPEQIGMIASITSLFGLPVEKSTITAIVYATLGVSGATVGGKALANLAKCIPGYGTAIGSAISGAIAASITAAMGEAYIQVMALISRGEMKAETLETKEGTKLVTDIFKKLLGLKRDSAGKVVQKDISDKDVIEIEDFREITDYREVTDDK